LLRDVSQPVDVRNRKSLAHGDKQVLLMPGDTPWLAKNQCFVVSDVAVEQIAGKAWRRFASTAEMITALRSPSTNFGPDVRVGVHSRIISPLLDITLLFLGLPLVLSRESRNIFVAIGMCLGVVLGFFCVVILCQWLGNNCLITPATAAWAPLAIFVPLAMILCEPLRE
jgi:lipopolysaccharide export system permease protein